MTREEQIIQAATEDCAAHCNNRGFHSFIAGVRWADEHPKSSIDKYKRHIVMEMYIILSNIYEDWTDGDAINIEFVTPSLDNAKEKFEQFRKHCKLNKESKYIYEYSLRKYLVEGDYLDYEELDRCDNLYYKEIEE